MTDEVLLKQFNEMRSYISFVHTVPKNRRCQGIAKRKGFVIGNGYLAADKNTIYIYDANGSLVSGIRLENDNNLWTLGKFKSPGKATIVKTVQEVSTLDFIRHHIFKHTRGNINETTLKVVIDHA